MILFAFDALTFLIVSDAISGSKNALVFLLVEALSANDAGTISLADTALDVCNGTGETCHVGALLFLVQAVARRAIAAS